MGEITIILLLGLCKLNIFVGDGSISEANHQKRNLALDVNHMDVYHSKGAFTLSVRDSSVESPNTTLVIQNLHLHTMNIL